MSASRSPTPSFLFHSLWLPSPEHVVSNNPKKKKEQKAENPMNKPWISMRGGMKIIAFTSVGMAVLTAW